MATAADLKQLSALAERTFRDTFANDNTPRHGCVCAWLVLAWAH